MGSGTVRADANRRASSLLPTSRGARTIVSPPRRSHVPHLRAHLQQSLGGNYRLIRELTGGGMSRVFLAEDTELEREVAIKVLSPELVDETLLARFRQEVLQTARLQHPTIVPILDVGTLDDGAGRKLPYYVMQYVRGESVRSRLLHEPQLSVSLTVRILRGMLDALVHAHAHDVVHRDIKPENVFMSGTSVVLADFGVAKVAKGNAAKPSITSPGTTVGTPTYMAPEQLIGEEMTDHRSDLYSIGVVGYELLAGRLPWPGKTLTEMLSAKARNKITPLKSLRPDVPLALERVIVSCLSPDPGERPQSAIAMLSVVDAIAVTPVTPSSLPTGQVPRARWGIRRRPLVYAIAAAVATTLALVSWRQASAPRARGGPLELAVLYPSLDVSNARDSTLKNQLYHSLVSSLRPVSGLRILGEFSIPQLTERGLTPAQIADSLHVDSMIVIDAHPATGGSYLLSVELRRGKTNQRDVIAGPISLQSLSGLSPDSAQTLVKLLSGAVVAHLGLVSSNAEIPTTRTIDAWVAWSKGREAYAKRTPKGVAEAIAYFDRAISLDSTYSQAHADLASALASSLFYHYRRAEPPYLVAARAMWLADRAVQLQPALGDGYLARAYLGTVSGAPIEFLEENYGAERRLKSTNPNSQIWVMNLLAARSRYNEALPKLKEQAQADPQNPAARISVALYAFPAREYLTTVREAGNAYALHPGVAFSRGLELWGRVQLGGVALNDCGSLKAGPYLGARAACLDRAGRAGDARSVADSLFRVITDKAPVDSTFDLALYVGEMAMYYASRGETASARQWLREAFAESPTGLDARLTRGGVFSKELEAFADTLRSEGWKRVVQSRSALPNGDVKRD